MSAVKFDDEAYGRYVIESVRSQMDRFKKHGIEARFVLMNVSDYYALKKVDMRVCHNSDSDTVNGLEIVICEKTHLPTVTASPASLINAGLL